MLTLVLCYIVFIVGYCFGCHMTHDGYNRALHEKYTEEQVARIKELYGR